MSSGLTGGSSGSSGGNSAAGDVYISSSLEIKNIPNSFDVTAADKLKFISYFISLLLSKSFTATSLSSFNPDAAIADQITFTQYTDFMHPDPEKPGFLSGNNNGYFAGKIPLLMRKDKLKSKIPLRFAPPILPTPFEIQIRSSSGVGTFANDRQVDYILYYLAKVGYNDDKARVRNAFNLSYKNIMGVTTVPWTDAQIDSLIIYFTSPVQIGVNVSSCSGYNVPGSDKRTAIAVLHDRVECIQAVINDISGVTAFQALMPQYVAYDHGLGPLNAPEEFPNTPVDWRTWYNNSPNNPVDTPANDMMSGTNLRNWVTDGKVLIFESPLGSGTLSIYLSGFPFASQEITGSNDGNSNPEAKDGTYIRLCNGNNPYNNTINPNNGISAYDDRFIFYDKYYRVLANITPGESVRVTWCASLPTPGWISIVGT